MVAGKNNEARTNGAAISRLAELRRGTAEFFEMEWPGFPGALLKMRALTTAEVQACLAGAYERFREIGIIKKEDVEIPVTAMEDFEAEIAMQALFLSCRSYDSPWESTFAISVDDLRENTTPAQRAEMYARFVPIQNRQNPADVPASLHDEIIEIAKKGDVTRLRPFGLDVLASCLVTTVSRLMH